MSLLLEAGIEAMAGRARRSIWRRRSFLGLALALGTIPAALADPVVAVRLPGAPERLPGVAVRLLDGGERMLTVAELETLGIWRVRTISPWEEGEIVVEGPLLRDVLAHVGLERANSILVRSMDGFAQQIPRADWDRFPVILATRVDGRPLGRRHKGPTRIVYPLLQHPELASPDHAARWVWLIASIEGAD
ncbi:molybdopterin-dependent oxidoreductase [Geminicoccus roseus]|uniref:molybdopterin-dependent oxidoreductase n=1 Tax=Geminicoccus roseus TaxID=404900 RepID=UPI0003FFA3EE|nr:molybdopterin-dependent oxidoreductase [Geminicoccus roseus]